VGFWRNLIARSTENALVPRSLTAGLPLFSSIRNHVPLIGAFSSR